MNEKTVEEVYAANSAIREKLREVVLALDAGRLYAKLPGEQWSIAEIIEHLTMVENGAIRICTKLLYKAKEQSKAGDGKVRIADTFVEKGIEIASVKLEAPEVVLPSGNKSLADSFAAFDANAGALNQLKEQFETVDSEELKFPHPYFGGLSAGEWLVLIGAHEARHLRQIKSLLEKL